MRSPFRRRHDVRTRSLSPISILLAVASFAAIPTDAISFTPAPSPNLDLSQLGRVGVAGDFSGVSLFQYEEQNENPYNTNGSQSLLAPLPNGVMTSLVRTDASIQSMCTFMLRNGTMEGVVLAGNFTSLNGDRSTAIALFNPNTSQTTPLAGLQGQVNALLCDQETDTVYVGGNFRHDATQSTNAMKWFGTEGWTALPFAGFNGPVTSITKAANGHIIFGGSFTGLGNASTLTERDGQVINLSTADISSGSSTSQGGFSDPKNIICKGNASEGSGNTWLLEDDSAGFWGAKMEFTFHPTKLRIRNTHEGGRGTRTWRYTALPINGIMNMTYIDPATNENATCTSECPLSDDPEVEFQEFRFINVIGMNEFRIDISDWYGSGGGLAGIELFSDDVFSYAVNDLNEPSCQAAGVENPSRATTTGPWKVSPSHDSSSQYLVADLSGTISSDSAAITFFPDVRQSGNYSVNLYTPGCRGDDTCDSRHQVRVTGAMGEAEDQKIDISLYQSNNFDKYDQIYFGSIDASSTSFKPTVTMTPLDNQDISDMKFVAQRIGFSLINSTGGLNGLFEFDPSADTFDTSHFSKSAFDRLGSDFSTESAVNVLATGGNIVYIGGNFTSDDAKNIISIDTKETDVKGAVKSLDGGLNGEVHAMYLDGDSLYVGGDFTSTLDNTGSKLDRVAVYDVSKNSWSALGGGVDSRVFNVVPLKLNITKDKPETVIALTGDFTSLQAFGDNEALPATGFGVWVPSHHNWLQSLDVPVPLLDGALTAAILDLPGGGSLFAGTVSSAVLSANGAVTLGKTPSQFPIHIKPQVSSSTSALSRRAAADSVSVNGVVTGTYFNKDDKNITILAGHFAAKATNGSTVNNLLMIDAAGDKVTGFGSSINETSTIVAVAIQGDNLFAGGNITGQVGDSNVNGLVSYNLAKGQFNDQPPALRNGNSTTVSAIGVRPKSGDVYVGGSFTAAGSLGCPGVCMFQTSTSQWQRPGLNLKGVTHCMLWQNEKTLVAGGELTLDDSKSASLVSYDVEKTTWTAFPGSDQLPGPVEVVTAASRDNKQLWVSGTASNDSVYLMKYDGSKWRKAGETLGPGTVIRGLQVFSLTKGHESTDIMEANRVLLLTGSIEVPSFGTASSVIFNGTSFEPYALTTNSGNAAGSVSRVFSEKQDFFNTNEKHLALGLIVLIALAISLGIVLLIVVAGLVLDRLRKKREGYVPAPTSMFDRGSGMQRIPPQELLQSLGQGRSGAPHV